MSSLPSWNQISSSDLRLLRHSSYTRYSFMNTHQVSEQPGAQGMILCHTNKTFLASSNSEDSILSSLVTMLITKKNNIPYIWLFYPKYIYTKEILALNAGFRLVLKMQVGRSSSCPLIYNYWEWLAAVPLVTGKIWVLLLYYLGN